MVNLFSISGGLITGIVIAVVVLLIIIVLIAFVNIRNSFVRLKNNVDESWSTIDIFLKKRYDLIPNLVETVKGYTKHESGTLEAVIGARSRAMNSSGDDKIDAENQLSGALNKVFLLREQYPQLKADSQFMNLSSALQKIENELASARKYYNEKVRLFNTKIELFPSSIVAKRMRLEKRKFFETVESERENVKVSF